MSVQVDIDPLRDNDEYHILVPQGVVPQYGGLRHWLTVEGGFSDRDAKGIGEAQASLLLRFRALYLLLRSANSDTLELEREYALWRPHFHDSLEDSALALANLNDCVSEKHHADVVREARLILESIRSAEPSDVGECGHGISTLPQDPTIVPVPSRGAAYPVYFEHSFVMDMVEHWHEPSLVSTSHALETLMLLSRRRAPGGSLSISPSIYEYVTAHYVEGAFRPALGAEPNLYGTRSAIVVFKSGLNLPCEETLDPRLEEQVLPAKRREDIIEFTRSKVDSILKGDLEGATIIDLFHGLYILKNLSYSLMKPGVSEHRPSCPALVKDHVQDVVGYLHSCFRAACPADGWQHPGFVLAPEARQRCITACMFAHRILTDNGVVDDGLSSKIDSCEHFVRAGWVTDGGFGSSSRAAPDLVHTYLGVTLCVQRGWDFGGIPDYRRGVERFLARCCKAGGYALGVELKPSAYGTRLALQIRERFNLPVPDPFEVEAFISSLGSQSEGYRGFHARRPCG